MSNIAPYRVIYKIERSSDPESRIYSDEDRYPAHIWKEGELHLPLRRLRFDEGDVGIALLMTSAVEHKILNLITDRLTTKIDEVSKNKGIKFEGVAGIAKLGYSLAQKTSEKLGFSDWIPVDSGRKNWYKDDYSSQASSISSGEKMMYIDPFIINRVKGKIALIDDAVFTGGSTAAAIKTLQSAGAAEIHFFPVFTEGYGYTDILEELNVPVKTNVHPLGHLPVFKPTEDGKWRANTETI